MQHTHTHARSYTQPIHTHRGILTLKQIDVFSRNPFCRLKPFGNQYKQTRSSTYGDIVEFFSRQFFFFLFGCWAGRSIASSGFSHGKFYCLAEIRFIFINIQCQCNILVAETRNVHQACRGQRDCSSNSAWGKWGLGDGCERGVTVRVVKGAMEMDFVAWTFWGFPIKIWCARCLLSHVSCCRQAPQHPLPAGGMPQLWSSIHTHTHIYEYKHPHSHTWRFTIAYLNKFICNLVFAVSEHFPIWNGHWACPSCVCTAVTVLLPFKWRAKIN